MKRICKNPQCNRTDIKGYGYCHRCYQRYKRNGDTELRLEYNGPRKQYPEEYKSWLAMNQRCNNKNSTYYSLYGGRGITVCKRWSGAYGFSNFVNDMGRKPSYKKTLGGMPVYSLDRIDSNGIYCKENCKWSNWKEQESNRRTCKKIPGVNWDIKQKKWRARFRANGCNLNKYFKNYDEAVVQRHKWEKEYPPC